MHGRWLPLVLVTLALGWSQDCPGSADNTTNPVVEAPVRAQQRLARVGAVMQAAAEQQYPQLRSGGLRLRFLLADSSLPDAGSGPDGSIYLTSGLMSLLASQPDDDLAAVLGHELTHIAQRHIPRALLRVLLSASVGALVAGALGAGMGAGLAGAESSRDSEYRADAGSIDLLLRAGYDPAAMGHLLGVLAEARGDYSTGPRAWRLVATHPPLDKRLESAARRVRLVTQASAVASVPSPPDPFAQSLAAGIAASPLAQPSLLVASRDAPLFPPSVPSR